jgi:hypothetical protein
MTSTGWNPWKLTAIGLALVVATAVIAGVVVANWSGNEGTQKVVSPTPKSRVAQAAPAAAPAVAAPPVGVPSQTTVDACNQQAAQSAPQNKTTELVKDGAIGAVVGAAVGAAGGAIADGGSGAGKGAVIGGVLGAGGGALYGVNENRKADERYRAAYASCLRSRGYTS